MFPKGLASNIHHVSYLCMIGSATHSVGHAGRYILKHVMERCEGRLNFSNKTTNTTRTAPWRTQTVLYVVVCTDLLNVCTGFFYIILVVSGLFEQAPLLSVTHIILHVVYFLIHGSVMSIVQVYTIITASACSTASLSVRAGSELVMVIIC